jgi:glucans biosynthesis protein C
VWCCARPCGTRALAVTIGCTAYGANAAVASSRVEPTRSRGSGGSRPESRSKSSGPGSWEPAAPACRAIRSSGLNPCRSAGAPALVPTIASKSCNGWPARSCTASSPPIIHAAPSAPPPPRTNPTRSIFTATATDAAQIDWFRPFYTVNAAVGLGPLFLLAGYLAPPSYDRKRPRRFLRERWSRLGVPLVVFALARNLPIALASEQLHSIGAFVVSLYRDAWATLKLHLWFLGHLPLYSAIYIAWRRFAGPPRSWPTLGHRSILAFSLGLIAVTWVVRRWYSVDELVPMLWVVPPSRPACRSTSACSSWARWRTGATGYATPQRSGQGMWLFAGMVASAGMAAIQMLAPADWRYNELANGGVGWQSLVRSTLEGLICVGLAVGVPVVIRYLVHRSLRLVSAMAATSYAAYILHLYIVVPIQVAITGLDQMPLRS